MPTPLIFFAFANDDDAHLDLLKEESRLVFRALEELDRKEYLKIYREESASAKDIFGGFIRYKDRVAIFHYGGHANGTHLELEEGAGDAQGLAGLMGEQNNLKLVFLNGCSSKGQVKTLMESGVKAVIATSVPIEDRKATEFSQQFYEALAHRRNIGQAFQLASSFLKTKYGGTQSVEIVPTRAMSFGKKSAEKKEQLPWGLYIQEEHQEEILNWKLPYFRPISLPDDVIAGIKRDFTANRYIIQTLNEMGKFNPDIYHKMVEQKGDQTAKIDSSGYPQLIISSFPWPIGNQIRILFVNEWKEFGQARLKQLLSTYIISSQVLYYILLSDLWEQVREGNIPVPKDMDLELPKDKEAFASKDWLGLIAPMYNRMEKHKAQPFIPEYELLATAWADPKSSLRKAHGFLENLRGRIHDLPKADLDKVCLKVEQAVALVLRQAAFLSRYRMLTIRNISLHVERTQDMEYELDMGHLNNSDGNFLSLYKDADKRRKQSYTNSRAIVLVYNEDHMNESLDLSPFFMDRNTFVSTLQGGTSQDTTAKLYLIAWQKQMANETELHYISVDPSLYTSLEQKIHQIHTNMTQADFDEGKNTDEELEVEEDDFFDADFGDEFEEESLPIEVDESPKAFELLKRQYETFVAEISIPQTPKTHA